MKTQLTATMQLEQKIKINAPKEKVWEIFNNQSLLPKWTHDVQKYHYSERMSSPGQLRRNECVDNGKKGTIETRCLTMFDKNRAEFQVEKDSFGMTKMFVDTSFAAGFHKLNKNQTEFVMQSYYNPKNFLIKLMNPFIKRKMEKEVEIMIKGLKDFIETGKPNSLNPINKK